MGTEVGQRVFSNKIHFETEQITMPSSHDDF